jgi:hypothetical protein
MDELFPCQLPGSSITNMSQLSPAPDQWFVTVTNVPSIITERDIFNSISELEETPPIYYMNLSNPPITKLAFVSQEIAERVAKRLNGKIVSHNSINIQENLYLIHTCYR